MKKEFLKKSKILSLFNSTALALVIGIFGILLFSQSNLKKARVRTAETQNTEKEVKKELNFKNQENQESQEGQENKEGAKGLVSENQEVGDTFKKTEEKEKVEDAAQIEIETETFALSNKTPRKFRDFPNTDLSNISDRLELGDILNGGPRRDGIPAIDKPQFVSAAKAQKDENLQDDILGIVLENKEGIARFYPYTILVWHEIVNDVVDEKNVAVTFCPLCGSAIVYDATVDGEPTTIGVSGFLWQSNMIMYDRLTESFWSQSLGESIVGDQLGNRLAVVQSHVSTFEKSKERYGKKLEVLSTETGFSRRYGVYPYGGYDNNEDLYFAVNKVDERFPLKEIFYVVPTETEALAIRISEIEEGRYTIVKDNKNLTLIVDGDIVLLENEEGEVTPGFREMWFSFATQHPDDGVVITKDLLI